MRDEALTLKIENGDRTVLEELVTKYYPELMRYCRWHMPDNASAEDAVQETFLKVIRHISSCRFSGNFRAFLYKVAAHTCMDLKKAKWNTIQHFGDIDGYSAGPTGSFEEVHDRILVRKAVLKLSKEEQEIIVLRFGQKLKLREIADIMHMPMRTLQSKLRMTLKKLKKDLEEV